MFHKILVVCVGNICRSPTAECLLKARLPETGYTISSAGIHALKKRTIEPTAQEVLVEHGYDFSTHSAQQLDREHLRNAELILVMEKGHIDAVLGIAPEARGKVFLLGKWQDDREIPDPFKQPKAMFEHSFALIDEAVNAWIKRLK